MFRYKAVIGRGPRARTPPAQETEARQKVSNFLKEKVGDEHNLAVEGLKYLLGHDTKPRRAAHLSTASSNCCGS